MIKFELETPQPGVVFYGNRQRNRQSGTTAVILNIQADAGVKEVRFTSIKGSLRFWYLQRRLPHPGSGSYYWQELP